MIPKILLPLITAFIEGVWSLNTKIGTQAIITSRDEGAHNFKDPFTWIAFLTGFMFATLKILAMNYSFHHFEQTEVVPTYMSGSMIANIVIGAVCL